MNLKSQILIFACMTPTQELKLCKKVALFNFLGFLLQICPFKPILDLLRIEILYVLLKYGNNLGFN